jgi:DNA modification methylase
MNKILLGDCRTLLKEIPQKSVPLIFADPPFNIGFKYDVYDDKKTYQAYQFFTQQWIRRCVLRLAPHGSMFVAIGDEWAAQMKLELDKHLTFRNWIIWQFSFGQNCTHKFNRCHAHILYYVKDSKHFTFNADSVKVPSDRQTKYNDKRAKEGGKIPDDVWNISRVCGTFKERRGWHGCQMPESLLERIVKVASNPGDLVVDPFCGSGTTAAVAKRLGRRYWTCDVSAKYVKKAKARLSGVEEGLAFG